MIDNEDIRHYVAIHDCEHCGARRWFTTYIANGIYMRVWTCPVCDRQTEETSPQKERGSRGTQG